MEERGSGPDKVYLVRTPRAKIGCALVAFVSIVVIGILLFACFVGYIGWFMSDFDKAFDA